MKKQIMFILALLCLSYIFILIGYHVDFFMGDNRQGGIFVSVAGGFNVGAAIISVMCVFSNSNSDLKSKDSVRIIILYLISCILAVAGVFMVMLAALDSPINYLGNLFIILCGILNSVLAILTVFKIIKSQQTHKDKIIKELKDTMEKMGKMLGQKL